MTTLSSRKGEDYSEVGVTQFVEQMSCMSHCIVQADDPVVRRNHRQLQKQGQAGHKWERNQVKLAQTSGQDGDKSKYRNENCKTETTNKTLEYDRVKSVFHLFHLDAAAAKFSSFTAPVKYASFAFDLEEIQ